MNEFSAMSTEELNQVEGGLAPLAVAGAIVLVFGATIVIGAAMIAKINAMIDALD